MGTSGTWARIARYAAPERNGRSSPFGVRPPSGKTNSGMPARKRLHRSAQARERGVRIRDVDGHLAGALQIPADQRPLPQIFLGQNAELEGQRGKDHRRVHVRSVVGRVHGDWMLAQVLRALHFQLRQRNPHRGCAPRTARCGVARGLFCPPARPAAQRGRKPPSPPAAAAPAAHWCASDRTAAADWAALLMTIRSLCRQASIVRASPTRYTDPETTTTPLGRMRSCAERNCLSHRLGRHCRRSCCPGRSQQIVHRRGARRMDGRNNHLVEERKQNLRHLAPRACRAGN